MTQRLISHRRKAAVAQCYRCYYCDLQMWEDDPAPFMARHGLSRRQAEQRRCTAEHLKPRSEGGTDASKNIVAACWFCNRTRHRAGIALSPEQYKHHIRRRRSG